MTCNVVKVQQSINELSHLHGSHQFHKTSFWHPPMLGSRKDASKTRGCGIRILLAKTQLGNFFTFVLWHSSCLVQIGEEKNSL